MDKNNNFILEEIPEPPEAKIPIQLTQLILKDDDLKIRLDGETKKELEEMAKKHKLTMSEVARQLIRQGLDILKNAEKK